MDYAGRETQQDIQTLRMSKTPRGLQPERSVQPSSHPEPERRLSSPDLFQLKLPSQDPAEARPPTELELHKLPLRRRRQDLEYQQPAERIKPAWRKCGCALSVVILALCLCAIFLGVVYYVNHFLRGGNQNQEVLVSPCNSPACQRASVHLSISADPFTHPCDYFLFSCGPDRPSSSKVQGHQRGKSRRDVKEKRTLDRKTELLQYLREILESNDELAGSAVQKAKEFYRSCLDTKSLDIAGEEPFLALIHKLGGWSVSGPWNQTDFNSTLSTLMRDYATFPFFNVYVGEDPTNASGETTTRRYIQIDQPDLLIPIEWNNETETSRSYEETLLPFFASCDRYLALLGAPPGGGMIHIGTFISLSSELAVAMAPLSHRRANGQLYQRLTIKELQRKAPAVDWLRCLQAAFHSQPLAGDDHVLLHNLPYIVQMSRIIGKWLSGHELSSSGPLHTFMVLNLLHTFLPALDSRFSDTANNLSVVLGQGEVRQRDLNSKTDALSEVFATVPRWKRCVLETERGFDGVLAYLLGENVGGGEAEELIENILSSFKSQLLRLKWSDQKTLQFVWRKVQSVTPRIVTAKEKSSEAELDLRYSEVSVNLTNFFSNYLQLLSLLQKRRSRLLHEDSDGADVLSVAPSRLGNELIIPTGVFIPPLFHPTYPRAVNYGVMGFLLAKDLLHVLLPDIYSQSETVRGVGQCVWSHYRSVTNKESGEPLGLLDAQRQEVWVQFSALQIALEAYQQSVKTQSADTSISGFSHARLFFMAFSQVNCDADRYHHLMPFEPSFLITAICAQSRLCPTKMQCPKAAPRYSSHGC